jgi:hypothetical protein
MSRSAGYQAIRFQTHETQPLAEVEEIGPGQREAALRLIQQWLTEARPEIVKISDPYFGPADLEFLKLIRAAAPQSRVEILTGEKKQRDLGLAPPYEDAYEQAWSAISQQAPPETYVVVAGLASNAEAPFHERYLICGDTALELGTSISGLGGNKISKITRLSRPAALKLGETLDQYLTCRVKHHSGERIRFAPFSLLGQR